MSTIFPPGVMLILPSRMAVARKQYRLLNESSSGVILGPRVITFGRLESEISGETLGWAHGDDPPRVLSKLDRYMVLKEIVGDQNGNLPWLKGMVEKGLIKRAARIIELLKANGLGPGDLVEIAQGVIKQGKLEGLVQIHGEYEERLRKHHLIDQADVRTALVNALANGFCPRSLSHIEEISVLDFNRLTPFQIRLCAALLGVVPKVRIRLTVPDWAFRYKNDQSDTTGGNPFVETMITAGQLESIGRNHRGLDLEFIPPAHEKPPALARTLHLFNREQPIDPPPAPIECLTVFSAPGRYAEIEEIGRRIRGLLDRGVKPESIAVAVRDLGIYGELFEDVFRRFRLPLHFRRGSPLERQAPVRALKALMRLAVSNWERELVLDIWSSPYLDTGLSIPLSEASRLSGAAGVTDERAGGGWSVNLKRYMSAHPAQRSACEAILTNIQEIKRLLEPLAIPRTWSEFAENAVSLLRKLKLEERIREGESKALHRDASAWELLRERLAELARIDSIINTTEKRISPGDLMKGLDLSMEEANVGQSAAHSIGGIMVLSVFDLHGLQFDYLFLPGLNEGEFPRPTRDEQLLSDEEQQAVNRAVGKRIFKSSFSEYREEELLFYFALAAAREKMILSYARTDERGRVRLPSALLDDVLRLWPPGEIQIEELPFKVTPDLCEVLTREELFTALAAEFGGEPEDDSSFSLNILSGLLERSEERDTWDEIVRRARSDYSRATREKAMRPWDALEPWLRSLPRYQGAPMLVPSWLEKYGQCPFMFWMEIVVGARPMDEAADEISRMDEGTILHRILCGFLQKCRDRTMLPLSGKPEEGALLASLAEKYWQEAERLRVLGRTPLWDIRRDEMERVLEHWLTREQEQDDGFIPSYFEWEFGPGRKDGQLSVPPLEIPLTSGDRLYIRGRVDRIDISPDKARILDYKNSSDASKWKKRLKPEEMGKTSFQAPLYQLAVAAYLGLPAEAQWIVLRDFGNTMIKPSISTDDDFFAVDPETRQEMAEAGKDNFFNRLEDTWNGIAMGRFDPNPDKDACAYCSYKTICRGRI